MALGDALYSLVMSGGRTFKLTRSDFSGGDWGGLSDRVASVQNLLYVTRLDVITDKTFGATDHFLEIYSGIVDGTATTEETFLWSQPLTGDNNSNSIFFFQPLRVDQLDVVIRTSNPYPDGATLDMSTGDRWLVMVEGYPRNFS
jgi:hypothetical protein